MGIVRTQLSLKNEDKINWDAKKSFYCKHSEQKDVFSHKSGRKVYR